MKLWCRHALREPIDCIAMSIVDIGKGGGSGRDYKSSRITYSETTERHKERRNVCRPSEE